MHSRRFCNVGFWGIKLSHKSKFLRYPNQNISRKRTHLYTRPGPSSNLQSGHTSSKWSIQSTIAPFHRQCPVVPCIATCSSHLTLRRNVRCPSFVTNILFLSKVTNKGRISQFTKGLRIHKGAYAGKISKDDLLELTRRRHCGTRRSCLFFFLDHIWRK